MLSFECIKNEKSVYFLLTSALLKIQTRGFCAPKQILLKGGDSPVKIQGLEKA